MATPLPVLLCTLVLTGMGSANLGLPCRNYVADRSMGYKACRRPQVPYSPAYYASSCWYMECKHTEIKTNEGWRAET